MTIRPLLGGRIRIGYPQAVGTVDVNVTSERLLSENHLIGRLAADGSRARNFAFREDETP